MRKRRYQSKNKGRTILRLGILLMIPLLFVGLIVGMVKLLKNRNRDVVLSPVNFGVGDIFTYTGRGFLGYKEGKLIYKDDSDAKKNFELSVSSDGSDVGVAASENLSILYNNSSVLLVGSGYPVEFSGLVSKVDCGESHFAVLKQEAGNKDSLHVYDKDANQIRQLDFDGNSTFLLNFGFDTTGEETLWTLSMDVTGASPVCTITTYNLDQSVTNGLMTIQEHLVEGVYFARSSVLAVSTDYIIRYARVGNSEAYRCLIYGWEVLDASTTGTQPLFLLRQRGETGYSTVKLVSMPETDNGQPSISMVQLPDGCLNAFLSKDKLIVYTKDHQYSYNAKGEELSSVALEKTIGSAEKLSDEKVLLSSEGLLYAAAIH